MNTEEENNIIQDINKYKNKNYGLDNHEYQVLAEHWEQNNLILRALRAILIRLGNS